MISTLGKPPSTHETICWPDFALGIGTGRLCSLNGGISIRSAGRLISRAFELGVRFVDTAPIYGQGQAESAIGSLAPHLRNELVVCSKVGYTFGNKVALINAAKPILRHVLPFAGVLRHKIARARSNANANNSFRIHIEPSTITTALDGTLRRIRRDYLDLLLLHDPSAESVENEANQLQLNRLVESRKIGAWGISSSDVTVIERAISASACSIVQFPVNREWLATYPDLMQRCERQGVSVIANGVLAPLSPPSESSLASHCATTVEDCFAFALGQPAVRVLLCGTRKVSHLERNVQIVRSLLVNTG